MKESLLVHLFGAIGVADEDDLDMPIAPLQEDVEQHVEALRQVLHMLGHRARHVHQAEHHRLGHRLRHGLETAITDIDRVDERYPASLRLQGLDLRDQLGAARLVLAIGELSFELSDLFRPRLPQRNPPHQRPAYGAAYRNIRRRTGGRIAGALDALAFRLGQLALGEIGQFEIVEEEVYELVATEDEAERILALAFTGVGGPAAPIGARPRQDIALDELLVTGQHHVTGAAFAVEAWLVHPVQGDADLAAFQDILDVAVLRRLLDGSLN